MSLPTRPPQAQQPLEFSPGMLVAIGLVFLVGVVARRQPQAEPMFRPPLNIVRVAEEARDFPSLGLRVQPQDGWTLLSIAAAEKDFLPTFVNEANHLIVRLQPFPFRKWPANENELRARGMRPPPGQPKPESEKEASGEEDGEPRPAGETPDDVSPQTPPSDVDPSSPDRASADEPSPDAAEPLPDPNGESPEPDGPRPDPASPIESTSYAHVRIDWIEFDRPRMRGSATRVGRLQEGAVDVMVTVLSHSEGERTEQSLSQLCDTIDLIRPTQAP